MAKIDKKYDIKFINHWDNGFHFSKMIWRERCRWRNTWWWLDLEPHFQHWYGITTLTSIYCLNARPPLLMIQRWDGNIFFQGTIANDVFPMFFHLSTITIECFFYSWTIGNDDLFIPSKSFTIEWNGWRRWFFSDGSWVRQPLVTMDSKPKGIIVEV